MSNSSKMTVCKCCQAPIAKSAKSCPSCGARNKKPLYRRGWFILLIIIVLIVGRVGYDWKKAGLLDLMPISVQQESPAEDGLRPSFKAAMDSYEAFYDDYCDFMRLYDSDASSITLLADYTAMVLKAAYAAETFEAWDDDLSDAELKYYIDVNYRVTQKLLGLVQ